MGELAQRDPDEDGADRDRAGPPEAGHDVVLVGRIAEAFARLRQWRACLKGATGKQRFRRGLGRLEDRPRGGIGQADLVADHPVPGRHGDRGGRIGDAVSLVQCADRRRLDGQAVLPRRHSRAATPCSTLDTANHPAGKTTARPTAPEARAV
jgi:hypothetical protein